MKGGNEVMRSEETRGQVDRDPLPRLSLKSLRWETSIRDVLSICSLLLAPVQGADPKQCDPRMSQRLTL